MLDGEEQIIARAIRGESSAFGSLYGTYQPQIYRFVYLKVSHREEAEDLTHQVFLSAWQNIETYRHEGYPFSSWLYQIARNKVIDFYRARKQERSLEEFDPDAFGEKEQVTERTETSLELDRLKKALRAMRPEYQEIVILRFIEELSIKEVAHILLKTEGAVKLLQHRAIKNLRAIIDNSPHA
jgi:RNA polymerase sigma-70 factor (ECF subfamily)